MPGYSLSRHGGVQLGVDTNYVIADKTFLQGVNPKQFRVWLSADFNPVPPVSVQPNDAVDIGAGHGMIPGVDFPGTRRYEFTVFIQASNAGGLAKGIEAVSSVCTPVQTRDFHELAWQYDQKKMFVVGRYRSFELDTRKLRGLGSEQWAAFRVRFETATPWIYDCQLVTPTPIFNTNGNTGSSRPFVLPLLDDRHTVATVHTLVGVGEPIYTFTIPGPATNPTFVEGFTGQVMGFGHTASQVVLGSGENLVYNSLQKRATRTAPAVDETYVRYLAAGSSNPIRLAKTWGSASNQIRPAIVAQSSTPTITGFVLSYYPAYYGLFA